jgi:cytochrome P450
LNSSSQERTARAQVQLGRYLQRLIEEHRSEPRDDLLTALIAARDEGERLTERELVATCVLLLVAGFETTVNLIGNGTLALTRNPHQIDRLRGGDVLVANAIDEMLRYDSPVQLTSRVVNDDTELADGRRLPGGHEIISIIGGANRDPAMFDNPDGFDVGRGNANSHISFSTGIHHCLGAALARMEAQAVFDSLLRRGRPESPEPSVRRPTMVLRGLSRMPLKVAS